MTNLERDSSDRLQIEAIGQHIRQALALVDGLEQPLLGAKLHDCLVHLEHWAESQPKSGR